jgi:ribose transport system substrate-binding protein
VSAFIRDFFERETVSRRNFLLASAAALTTAAMPGVFGGGMARAALTDPVCAWSYRDRANPYSLSIVSGGEAFIESIGWTKEDTDNLINAGSSEKSLADIKALLAKHNGNCAIARDANARPHRRAHRRVLRAWGHPVSFRHTAGPSRRLEDADQDCLIASD